MLKFSFCFVFFFSGKNHKYIGTHGHLNSLYIPLILVTGLIFESLSTYSSISALYCSLVWKSCGIYNSDKPPPPSSYKKVTRWGYKTIRQQCHWGSSTTHFKLSNLIVKSTLVKNTKDLKTSKLDTDTIGCLTEIVLVVQ